MKNLFLTLLLFTTTTSQVFADIKEFDPTKVLVNTETGEVVFTPTQMDYQADLSKLTLILSQETALRGMDSLDKSLMERIFGKKGCSKR